jgi:CheY-like chemotaxis protein
VKELHSKPQKVNPSSRRTVAEAAETLRLFSTLAVEHLEESMPSPLILVVDDDSISRETTCMALEQAHLRALSLDDPLLALKLAGENRFDLILSDVQMPQMNGVDLCKKIHATTTNAKTPVIFVTSLNEFESQVRSGLGNGVDFIAKPIMLVELAVKALTLLLNRTARA